MAVDAGFVSFVAWVQTAKGESGAIASVVVIRTVISGKPGTSVEHAAEPMAPNRISAIPVPDKNDGIEGIVNSTDEQAAASIGLVTIDGLGEVSMYLGRAPNHAWGI